MVTIKYFLVLLAVLGLNQIALANSIQPRMINGAPVETLERFPHHVTIEPIYPEDWNNNFEIKLCGGSIINHRWILTSANCVRNSSRLQLHFQKLYRDNTSGSHTVIVNNNERNVVVYPTNHDDIALVDTNVQLIFSNAMKPISLSRKPLDQLQNKLAVLPGFDGFDQDTPTPSPISTASLTYSMLRVVPNSQCKSEFKAGAFDEYNNMCCTRWGNNINAPCIVDSGCGLVVGWPAKPELAAIYSDASRDCDSRSYSSYTNVQKYISWIDSVTLINPPTASTESIEFY